jgi:hypothetical protein
VEVVSPNDPYPEVAHKRRLYRAHGTRLVWIVDPKYRTVEVHTSDGMRTLQGDDTLDGGDVLPGFTLPLRDMFPLEKSAELQGGEDAVNEDEERLNFEAVYLPDNEPYLGREPLYVFDQTIIKLLKENRQVAQYTHTHDLSELQQAACQIIPQGINLALTIRELIRQGYLFGCLVLMRSLIERVAVISYLMDFPDALKLWQAGWNYDGKDKRPSLRKMLEAIRTLYPEKSDIHQFVDTFNHITHGDPIGSQWNMIRLSDGGLGYSVGKVISDPQLCDLIAMQTVSWLLVLRVKMHQSFPKI